MRQATILPIAVVLLVATTAYADDLTLRVDVRRQRLEGTPIAWSDDQVLFLSRDGALWDFHPREASNYHKVSNTFRSYSQGELRRQLLLEFGEQFDVSGTGQFLVAHPAGQRDLWAERFDDLYRSFVHYFTARGMRPQSPRFPFIAVVFRRQTDFMKYAATNGVRISPGVLGYYSPTTNRILLFDRSAGGNHQQGWQENAETIIHEAAHQAAFNTGIHSRYSPPPRWVVEGLGSMFEARGVWNSLLYSQQNDRINRGRLTAFEQYVATRRQPGALAELISSDRSFRVDPDGAYAECWALTFYLAETQSQKYFQYLAKTAARPAFTPYRSPDRLKDFTAIFGDNLAMFETRFLRYIDSLR